MLGRELIVDVEDIENFSVLETLNGVKPVMGKTIENCKLKLSENANINLVLLVLQ